MQYRYQTKSRNA